MDNNDFLNTINKLNNMTDAQKKMFVKNINKKYMAEFKSNLSKWISIYDLLIAIDDPEIEVFITQNSEIKEIYKKIQASKIMVVSPEDYLKENKGDVGVR